MLHKITAVDEKLYHSPGSVHEYGLRMLVGWNEHLHGVQIIILVSSIYKVCTRTLIWCTNQHFGIFGYLCYLAYNIVRKGLLIRIKLDFEKEKNFCIIFDLRPWGHFIDILISLFLYFISLLLMKHGTEYYFVIN